MTIKNYIKSDLLFLMLEKLNQGTGLVLGDFLVFLTRVASSVKIQTKMTTTKWTKLLLRMIGHEQASGKHLN